MTASSDLDWREARSKARHAEKKRDFARAETLYRQALEMIESTIGPDSVPIAQILLCLGDCYDLNGRAEDAKALYKRARVILEKLT